MHFSGLEKVIFKITFSFFQYVLVFGYFTEYYSIKHRIMNLKLSISEDRKVYMNNLLSSYIYVPTGTKFGNEINRKFYDRSNCVVSSDL